MTQQTVTLLHFVRDNTGLSSRESVQPTICTVMWWQPQCFGNISVPRNTGSGAVELRNLGQSCQDSARCEDQAPGPGWMLPRNFQPVTSHLTGPRHWYWLWVLRHTPGYQQLFTLLIKYVWRNMSALIPNMLVHDACWMFSIPASIAVCWKVRGGERCNRIAIVVSQQAV